MLLTEVPAENSNCLAEGMTGSSFVSVTPEKSDQVIPASPAGGRAREVNEQREILPPEKLWRSGFVAQPDLDWTEGTAGDLDHSGHKVGGVHPGAQTVSMFRQGPER
jgi:hypothetical protein